MKKNLLPLSIAFILSTLFVGLPSILLAASNGSITYSPLAPIPPLGIGNTMTLGGSTSLATYLNGWVVILIQIATGLAVLYVVIGGLQYTLTESVTKKGEGRATIVRALGGLLLALTSYMILNTINPTLLTGKINGLENQSVGAVGEGQQGAETNGIEAVTNGRVLSPGDPGYPYSPEDPRYGSVVAVGGGTTAGQTSSNGLTSWGDPSAVDMEGDTISGRQTYYAPNETHTDSGTAAGLNGFGQQLVEGDANTVGSAASVYYPAGTLVQIGSNTYIIDDNNLVKQSDGTYKPANNVLTNNYTVDIFTNNASKANNTTTNNTMKVLYVPSSKVSSSGIQDIRNNPSKYIGSNNN